MVNLPIPKGKKETQKRDRNGYSRIHCGRHENVLVLSQLSVHEISQLISDHAISYQIKSK